MLDHLCFGEGDIALPKIIVEGGAESLGLTHTRDGINAVEVYAAIYAAGTVAHDDLGAPLNEKLRQRADQRRMSGACSVGFHGGYEVYLYGYFHVGFYPIKTADRLKDTDESSLSLRIIGAGSNRNVVFHK